MRESYVHTGRAHEAVVGGFQASARVVTAAALIMFAVFAGFEGEKLMHELEPAVPEPVRDPKRAGP